MKTKKSKKLKGSIVVRYLNYCLEVMGKFFPFSEEQKRLKQYTNSAVALKYPKMESVERNER